MAHLSTRFNTTLESSAVLDDTDSREMQSDDTSHVKALGVLSHWKNVRHPRLALEATCGLVGKSPPGGSDGVIGPKTRSAIKAFQKSAHLPADGFPTMGLLERLRGGGGGG